MSTIRTYLSDIRERAEKAKDKKAALGPDIDLSRYNQHIERGRIESLEGLSQQAREAAVMPGINVKEEARSGSYLQMDHSVVYERLNKIYEGKLESAASGTAPGQGQGVVRERAARRGGGSVYMALVGAEVSLCE